MGLSNQIHNLEKRLHAATEAQKQPPVGIVVWPGQPEPEGLPPDAVVVRPQVVDGRVRSGAGEAD